MKYVGRNVVTVGCAEVAVDAARFSRCIASSSFLAFRKSELTAAVSDLSTSRTDCARTYACPSGEGRYDRCGSMGQCVK